MPEHRLCRPPLARSPCTTFACNAFPPDVVDSPLWTKLDEDLGSIGDSESGRVATEDDIVGAALSLASDDSDYLTGQVVMIDGGMVLA